MKHIFHNKYNLVSCFQLLMLVLSMMGLSAMAQSHRSRTAKVRHTVAVEQEHVSLTPQQILCDSTLAKLDLLGRLARQQAPLDSVALGDLMFSSATPSALDDPYFATIVGNPALYPALTHRLFVLPSAVSHAPYVGSDFAHSPALASLFSASGSYSYLRTMQSITDVLLATACLQHPAQALNLSNVSQRNLEKKLDSPKSEFTPGPIAQTEEVTPIIMGNEGDWNIVATKPNFWTFKTNFSLQFTQNYVSDNWYKGGESHNALLAETILQANFNNRQKITFDNKLEMKLGFQTSHNDDEHKYKTNSDLLRLTNKLGLRAVKHWYYTVMLQSWTQFYKGYKANDKKVYSDFMSPFESLLSVGMDYQYRTKNNRFNVNATLSPVAVKLKYVGRSSLVTSFGLDEGKHTKWEYGSNITANYTWDIFKNVRWSGRIYYFTDYSSTQVEWENTFNFSINRYLSARIFLYPRFDDSRKRNKDQSNFEFNELLSLGLKVDF